MSTRAAVLVIFFALFSSFKASATSELERQHLTRIVNELEIVKEMVVEAKLLQKPGQVNRFKYEDLVHDLNVVMAGVQAEINGVQDLTYKRQALNQEKNSGER